MRFRGLVLLSGLDVRSLWPARIETSLLHRPAMAFMSVFVLLRLALSFGRINEHVGALRVRDASAENNKKSDQSARKTWPNPIFVFHLRLHEIVSFFTTDRYRKKRNFK